MTRSTLVLYYYFSLSAEDLVPYIPCVETHAALGYKHPSHSYAEGSGITTLFDLILYLDNCSCYNNNGQLLGRWDAFWRLVYRLITFSLLYFWT